MLYAEKVIIGGGININYYLVMLFLWSNNIDQWFRNQFVKVFNKFDAIRVGLEYGIIHWLPEPLQVIILQLLFMNDVGHRFQHIFNDI